MKKAASVSLFLLGALLASGVAILLYIVDPIRLACMPRCFFHMVTGLYCPGCGATRAIHQLLHGNFLTALHLNSMIILALLLLPWWGLQLLFNRRSSAHPMPHWLPWMVVSAVVLFGIVRNIPWGPFLALAPH